MEQLLSSIWVQAGIAGFGMFLAALALYAVIKIIGTKTQDSKNAGELISFASETSAYNKQVAVALERLEVSHGKLVDLNRVLEVRLRAVNDEQTETILSALKQQGDLISTQTEGHFLTVEQAVETLQGTMTEIFNHLKELATQNQPQER